MEHLLVCPQMGKHATHENLAELNDSARHCVSYCLGRISDPVLGHAKKKNQK